MTNTCKYCATPLTLDFFCDYCRLQFRLDDIKQNGERPDAIISDVPFNESDLEFNTNDLFIKKTIYLYYLLSLARKTRAAYYDEPGKKRYHYYEKKVWIIENILLERNGFYPKRINNKFKSEQLNDIQAFEEELKADKKNIMNQTEN